MHHPRPPATLSWLASLLVLLVIVAACSGDDTGDDATTATDDTTADDDASSESDDEGTTEPDDGDADDTEPSGDTAENFDSFRGVTADTIRVGITVPDFDALLDAGLQNYQGSNEVTYQAFVDRINAEGGISGRMIEPVYVGFNFLDATTQDDACVELTEDHEVFIVLYGLLSASNLCLTDLHDTMVMTDQFQTTELVEQSGDTPWLQLRAADDETTRILGSVLAEAGRLDGKTIGIIANGTLNDGADGDILEEALAELGFDSDVAKTSAPATDLAAQEAETAVIAERFEADGVDFLFNLLGGGDAAVRFTDAGYTPETAYSILQSAVASSTDPSVLDGAISVAARPDTEYWDDPEFRAACVDPVLEANPELEAEFADLPTGEEQGAGQPLWAPPVLQACNQTMLLQQIGEIVGADLTNESFRAALDELGPIELHGYGQASFTSDGKWDGLDEFYLQEYDAESGVVQIVGDPIILDR